VIRTGDKSPGRCAALTPSPKDRSYYPLLAHWRRPARSQTQEPSWQRPRLKGAERFVRELIGEIRVRADAGIRMDAAFFQQNLLKQLNAWGASTRSKYPCVGGPG